MVSPVRIMVSYDLLWACFETGQMTVMQLRQHMHEDDVFAQWVRRKLHKQN
jgi:hypothetical protein